MYPAHPPELASQLNVARFPPTESQLTLLVHAAGASVCVVAFAVTPAAYAMVDASVPTIW
jgi:hypothetical protein